MIKTFIIGLLCLISSAAAFAYNAVIVDKNDGTKDYVQLSKQLKMQVSDEALQFVSPDFDVLFPMEEVDAYRFGNHQFDALEEIAPDINFIIESKSLRLSRQGYLYDLHGVLVGEGEIIDLSVLRPGIYILKFPDTDTNRGSVKICIK